jgi:hypothetical protein
MAMPDLLPFHADCFEWAENIERGSQLLKFGIT